MARLFDPLLFDPAFTAFFRMHFADWWRTAGRAHRWAWLSADDGELGLEALRWMCWRIRFDDAPAWIDAGFVCAGEAVGGQWLEGFTADAARSWRIRREPGAGRVSGDADVILPHDAGCWHLDRWGQSRGLGLKRYGRRIGPWTPPLTKDEVREQRRRRPSSSGGKRCPTGYCTGGRGTAASPTADAHET